MRNEARQAQEIALSFFLSEYHETERLTALLVNAAQKVSPGPVSWSLSTRVSKAKGKAHKQIKFQEEFHAAQNARLERFFKGEM